MRHIRRTAVFVPSVAVATFAAGTLALIALAPAAQAATPVPVGTPPVAVITAPGTVYAGIPITLSGAKSSSSGSSDGAVSEWEWDLGNDGSFEYDSTSSPWVSKAFRAGSHTVTLRVRNEAGLISTAMKTLTVRKAPAATAKPAAPATVDTKVSGTTIDVTWTEGLGTDGALTYRVSNADDQDVDPIYVPATSDLSTSFENLVPGDYRIRVVGINRAGAGPATESTAVVLAKGATPSATPSASATPTSSVQPTTSTAATSPAEASSSSGNDRSWIGLVLIGVGVVLLLVAAIGASVSAVRRRRAE